MFLGLNKHFYQPFQSLRSPQMFHTSDTRGKHSSLASKFLSLKPSTSSKFSTVGHERQQSFYRHYPEFEVKQTRHSSYPVHEEPISHQDLERTNPLAEDTGLSPMCPAGGTNRSLKPSLSCMLCLSELLLQLAVSGG